MTRLQQIPMVSFLLSSSAPTTQTAQLNHGVHLSLKNPSVARGNSLGLMSPDPPEPPDPPDLGSVMVESNLVTVSFDLDGESDLGLMVTDFLEMGGGGSGGDLGLMVTDFPDPSYLSDKIQDSKEMVDWIIFCSAWTYGLV
ncbi:unnamed protein product [Brassica rapa]|uniref:Uncharacterized protein n=1 Tax=Brassica campestris TaxID=3711 RepID=A0A3P6C3X2_BRACM|nr:unnamed protein product [Brassica rapa]VDD03212.1 unnamed protein product [Brassica rapa]